MLPFVRAYSVPLLTGPIPDVAATFGVALGAEEAAGGFGAGRDAAAEERAGVEGREGAREGAVEGRAAAVRTGAGSFGALGAVCNLGGTGGP